MGKTDPTRKTALDQLRARLISKKFGGTPPKIKQKKANVVEFDFTPYPGQVIPHGSPQHIEILRQLIEAEGKMPAIREIGGWRVEEYGTGKLSEAVSHISKTYGIKIDINTSTGMDGVELHLYDIGVMHISRSELAIYTTEDMVKRIVLAFDLVKTGATIQSEPNKTESWTDKWLKENTSQK